MKEFLELLSEKARTAFEKAGYDRSFGQVRLSDRPELSEYQISGALSAAKQYKKNPMEIAESVAKYLSEDDAFSSVDIAKPGFLNLSVSAKTIADYLSEMYSDQERLGAEKLSGAHRIILDYGGPNVAKPLHVGHLRSAVIGESLKRILKFAGNDVIGDIHLGDFGLQMGLIIQELHERQPELLYFDEAYEGDYPEEAPFTIGELEEIYPAASAKSKTDEAFNAAAREATLEMQQGRRGYRELLSKIMEVSVTDLKRNYDNLSVSFDLWKGEADSEPFIPDMVAKMKADGFAHESEGALVVDVEEETDKKKIPPCMILKSDGAALYDTTDLATLIWRVRDYHPDEVLYVADLRQAMHFTQVFRCAKKTGIVPEELTLSFVGFGTVNGADGKALKTRDGGVMRLEYLIKDIEDAMLERIRENGSIPAEEAEETAHTVSIAALKYGDLKNQPAKDYIFDLKKFISSEGDTGPYILYTMVRMKSILRKYTEEGNSLAALSPFVSEDGSDKKLMSTVCRFQSAVRQAAESLSPNVICAYIYGLCNEFNHFYHETKILSCPDEKERSGYIFDIVLAERVLERCIDLLGFSVPERM